MCVQGLVLAILVVLRGVSCVCLWGVFLFLCGGGVCLSLVCILLLFGVLSFVMFVVHVCV